MIEKLELEQNPLSETVEKIREICPAAVTRDGKIDFEELKTSLATDVAEDTIEKYEFTWVGKNAAKAEANRPIRKTLRPVVVDSKDWDNTKNLYIEGDNLDALKLLQESYLNKVKMIYIDPPYNTGNDFVYCDNFKMGCAEFIEKSGQCDADGNRLFANTKTNGRFHSDWCSMMYPRMKIARNLLTDDGVIFISIDDNEVANLKKICDEVFGEENFQVCFPRVTKKGGKSSEATARNHDYVLMYKKSNNADIVGIGHDDEGYCNKDEHFEERGFYKLNQTLDYDSLGWVKSLDYPIEIDGEIFYAGGSKEDYEQRQAGRHGRADWGWRWRWSLDLFNFGVKHNFIEVKRGGSRPRIYTKTYQKVKIEKVGNEYQVVAIDRTKPLSTLDFTENKYSNDNATKVISELIGKGLFDYTKAPELVEQLTRLVGGKDFITLDFFSGSATTAHAVMQLNAEDGGNRRFIMVQLPEKCDDKSEAAKAGYKTICDIGKERIRRAGEKIKAENPGKDLDIGFRVLRVDSDNMADIAKRPSDITQGQLKLDVENIVPERSDLDLLFGVMVDCGLMLDMPIETKQMDDKTYYVVNHGDLVACFEKNIPEKLIYEIAKMNPVCAVFRDSSFAEPKDKINLAEIFKNITGNDKCVKVL